MFFKRILSMKEIQKCEMRIVLRKRILGLVETLHLENSRES